MTAEEMAERQALRTITHGVARASAEVPLRHQLQRDLASSLYTTEHKLDFASYLKGTNGGLLRAQVAQVIRVTPDSVSRLVAAIRPLELYLPVQEQRDAWTGDANLQVAGLLLDADTPVVFGLDGAEVMLAADTKPDVPTLVLTTVETDFSKPLDATRAKNRTKKDGAVGTYTYLPCSDCDGASGGGSTPIVPASDPTGLYFTYSDLYDDGEGWLKGAPEIEVHVIGPSPNDQPNFARSVSCAANGIGGGRSFDQNNPQWSGKALLLNQWDFQYNKFGWLAFYVGVGYLNLLHCDADHPLECDLGILGSLSGIVAAAWGIFTTNDDYLGLAITKSTIPEYSNPYASHALIKDPDKRLNGGIRLLYHRQGTDNY
jgi:hypothetical protein